LVIYTAWGNILFEKEHGMSKGEYKCKQFCDGGKYYYDRGGLSADSCECNWDVKVD